jgi:hypothetical protein
MQASPGAKPYPVWFNPASMASALGGGLTQLPVMQEAMPQQPSSL